MSRPGSRPWPVFIRAGAGHPVLARAARARHRRDLGTVQIQALARHDRAVAAHVVAPPQSVAGWKGSTARLAAGAVAAWGVLVLIGLALVHVLNAGSFHAADLSVDTWLARHRTGPLNVITYIGTTMAQTTTAVGVTVVVVLVLRWRLGRWHESGVFLTLMAGELLIFLGVTATVHRPRPPVARLDVAPETSSFPSGHTAAAMVLYGGIAIMILWVYGSRPATRVIAGVLFCVPVIVALSRLYRGMHYPTDVLGGALLGSFWLYLVSTTLLRHEAAPARAARRRPARGKTARRGRGARGVLAGARRS
jgi:membrane-associated phospholipid phosphatase